MPDTFRCQNCRLDVSIDAPGTTHRNHCPTCLWSRHLDDDAPGDRAADCGSSWSRSRSACAVTANGRSCTAASHCRTVHLNRIAGDDNPLMLMRLAVRPLAQPPFPLEWLATL